MNLAKNSMGCRRSMLLAFASLLFTTGCVATEPPNDLRADCVGRMQVALPGDFEMAAYSASRLSKELEGGSGQQQLEFLDGVPAGHGFLAYEGLLRITHPLSAEVRDRIQQQATALALRVEAWSKKINPETGAVRDFAVLPTSARQGKAWRVDGSYVAIVDLAEHVMSWGVSGSDGNDRQKNQIAFQRLLDGVSTRNSMTLPKLPGICLPYAFIRDSGKEFRDVRMTYRLQQQPDIQVLLKDAAAANPEPGIRTKNAEPKAVTVSFWSQQLTQAKEVRPLWEPSTRAVTLAGYGGLASFVQLTREDGSLDYGYLAVVRGDPRAKEDTPDLMLFIVRNSKAAKAKGKEPLGKDEFIKMSELIASSVKRRPVQ
jgi:hypothetical protein